MVIAAVVIKDITSAKQLEGLWKKVKRNQKINRLQT
jgi:hypothetical protein